MMSAKMATLDLLKYKGILKKAMTSEFLLMMSLTKFYPVIQIIL